MPQARLIDHADLEPTAPPPLRAGDQWPEARIHPTAYKSLYFNAAALAHLGRPEGITVQKISPETLLLLPGRDYRIRYPGPGRGGSASASMADLFREGVLQSAQGGTTVYRLARGNGSLYLHPNKPVPTGGPLEAGAPENDDPTAAPAPAALPSEAVPRPAKLIRQVAGADGGEDLDQRPLNPEEAKIYKALGRRVSTRRQALGISQTELALRCGLTRPNIIEIEAGKVRTPLPRQGRLAAALEMSREALITGGPTPPPVTVPAPNGPISATPGADLLARGAAATLTPTPEEAEEALYAAVGSRLRERRRALGVTQEYLAEAAGYTRTSVVNIEDGRQRAPLGTLARLAEILKISLDDLLHDRPQQAVAQEEAAALPDLAALLDQVHGLLCTEDMLFLPAEHQARVRASWDRAAAQYEKYGMASMALEDFRAGRPVPTKEER